MSDPTGDSRKEPNKSEEPEFKFSFNGEDAGAALGKGMDALKAVLGGFVNMAHEMIGPMGMRNLEASQWLAQVATSIEEVATELRQQGTVPIGKGGELTCFLERLDAEITGSKFESQGGSFRSRLQEALQVIERVGGAEKTEPSIQEVRRLTDSVGYFNAAAATGGVSV